MNTVYLIAATIFVLIFFRIAKLVGLKNRITQRYLPLLSGLELAMWAAIIIGSVDLLLSEKRYYPYLIILLILVFMLLLVWFYVKDIVAGYLFRVRHNPIKGQLLESDKVQGTIRMVGLSQLTVETPAGLWYRVPYSSLVTRMLSIQSPHGLSSGETVVRLHLDNTVDIGSFARKARESLALASWCVASKPINVQLDLEDAGVVRISFFMLDPGYLPAAKMRLEKLAAGFADQDEVVKSH